jgi:carbonic anhydrase
MKNRLFSLFIPAIAALTVACTSTSQSTPEPSVAPQAASETSMADWSYRGQGGPENWGSLSEDFAQCDTGRLQSPVDLITAQSESRLPELQVANEAFPVTAVNDGRVLTVDVPAGYSFLRLLDEQYELTQMQFHQPSEHRIDNLPFDMEIQLVYRSTSGTYGVVGIFVQKGVRDHAEIAKIWKNMPVEDGQPVTMSEAFDINAILPEDKSYYQYFGSLTTPPCTGGVAWAVMRQPIVMSEQQILNFRGLFGDNVRPLQDIANRRIKFKRSM